MSAPLAGIRVLDLGRFVAAPYCALILADMGADVIRVERPGGDDDRRLGLTGPHGETFTFANLARHKRGVSLDVRHPTGRRILLELAAQCDVFLHNFGPSAAAALRLTYEDVRAVRADVIYTAISAFGATGPDAHRTGFDPIAQTRSGAAALTGFDGEPPLRSGVPWVDYSTGLCAALGTALALRHRDATGEGQSVDCSLLQTAVSYVAPMIAEASVVGRERPRLGNRAAYLAPCDLYRCRDGYVYVVCVTDASWRSLAHLIGRDDLRDAADLQRPVDRFERSARIEPAIIAWMAERTVETVVAAMDDARIPCSAYRSTAQIRDDPQVRALGMLQEIDLQVDGLPPVPVGAVPFRLSSMAPAVHERPPRVGEHSAAVLQGLLGYTSEQIADLKARNII